MKAQLGILLIGGLVLVSGCARKCPPCPTSAPVSYGSASYNSAPMAAAPVSYSAPVSTQSSASPYSNSTGADRYVSK